MKNIFLGLLIPLVPTIAFAQPTVYQCQVQIFTQHSGIAEVSEKIDVPVGDQSVNGNPIPKNGTERSFNLMIKDQGTKETNYLKDSEYFQRYLVWLRIRGKDGFGPVFFQNRIELSELPRAIRIQGYPDKELAPDDSFYSLICLKK